MQRLLYSFVFLFVFLFLDAKNIDVSEFTLDNGLHVYAYKDTTKPIVSINVTYKVGSSYETPDKTGFAHFFEHLMFEGSANIKRGEFMSLVQSAGGNCNAETTEDYTSYYMTLPSHQFELGLWLESERMLHLAIDSESVETQRAVIKEERKLKFENRPYSSFIQELRKRTFKGSFYEWIPIGEVQYIDEAKLSEFISFYKTYYVPSNAVLVIAGDIDLSKIKSLVDKYFAGISGGNTTLSVTIPNKQFILRSTEIDTVYDNISLPAVFFGFIAPSIISSDFVIFYCIDKYLSAGENSQLYYSLVNQQQIALSSSTIYSDLKYSGLSIHYALGNTDADIYKLHQALEDELKLLANTGISEVNLQKVKNIIETSYKRDFQTLESIAYQLAQGFIYYSNPYGYINLMNSVDNVSSEDIMRVASQYLSANKVVLYYLPKQIN